MFNFFKKKIIPVVHISGVIGNIGGLRNGVTISSVENLLEKAFKIKNAPAVAIIINSPGGSPVQSSLIYKRIRSLASKKKVKVIFFVEDVAASGGYYIACAGDEIYVDENSIIGSIGVIYASFGFEKLIKKYGIERRIFTTGKYKSILDSFQKQKLSDVKKLKSVQMEIFKNFKNVVLESRNRKINRKNQNIFSGGFWVGKEAIKLGLVDGIGDLKTTMEKKFGKKLKYLVIKPKKSFVKSILSKSFFSKEFVDTKKIISDIIAYMESRNIWGRYGF
ncbi:MAG: putative signal peptide peptidase SppA [Alphaproteobacteria bacterium MarineAlpha6_Bin6]|nr:S49 family peptidase [Pelagibacteraceae bacterium]PPR29882.1 MAG: putative signal peptide peptidase SppA [Alphaproteobacteria bacterium MarineAlpha6_Bin6]PPR33424.1 MAG: putative signal peptide peptidase SppA [Alphaproteobacteria bacterium MarineAlpha6_Bin5]|tara:strand:- start:1152 stop:1982 length:831 start_codon:yes stop_codon:yes gene_type:complete